MHIPQGFTVVTPYIMVNGAAAYIEFLKAAFDASEIGRSTAPDGRIANSQVKFGDTTIMVSEATEHFPPGIASFYLYVADADQAMARALSAGAEMIMEVGDKPYGDRQGGVRDPAGNTWWLSQRLTGAPYFF